MAHLYRRLTYPRSSCLLICSRQHTAAAANAWHNTHAGGAAARKMDSPVIPDGLLLDIFLRLPTPADLIRASAACVSFRAPTAPSFAASASSTPRPSSASSTSAASTPQSRLTPPRRHPAPSPSPPTSPSPSSPPPPRTGPYGTSATAACSSTDPAGTEAVRGAEPSSRRSWCATPCTNSTICFPQSPMT
ncbi:hypothetical protein ACQ4PT_059234 [Festuca glaucescens]